MAPVMSEGRSVREVLAWSRSTVDPSLRRAVGSLPASTQRTAAYHFGWRDEHGHETEDGGGKAIRPALVLLTAAGITPAGAAPTAALPAAVAVELVHNFSLLHDDVMDGDTTRRHRPTAWSVFGTGDAILAGDALLTLATEVLAGAAQPSSCEQLRLLSGTVHDLLDGQSADLAFEQRDDVGLAECLGMAERKTGALLGCACALGAVAGGGCRAQVEQLRRFGGQLGLAFQFVDDLLGIWGDPAVTGKPVHSDLRTRKKTMPVVAALASGTAAGRELGDLYHREQTLCGPDLERAADLIDLAGGRDWSLTRAAELRAQALYHLESAGLTGRSTAELEGLARLVTARDH